MSADFLSFLKRSTLVSIILFIIGLVVFKFLIPNFYQPMFPFLLLFFYLLSLILQYLLHKIAKMNMLRFSVRFMAITMSKMFALIILALVYILLNKEGAVAFIVVFFLLYVTFTILEIQDIMKVNAKK